MQVRIKIHDVIEVSGEENLLVSVAYFDPPNLPEFRWKYFPWPCYLEEVIDCVYDEQPFDFYHVQHNMLIPMPSLGEELNS